MPGASEATLKRPAGTLRLPGSSGGFMSCSTIRAIGLAILSFAALAALPVRAQDSGAIVVNDFDVFVDPPTAFAFIKLPGGWKFIGKLDADQLRHLPPGTLTSLLPRDAERDATR